jgi:hypothetical protein
LSACCPLDVRLLSALKADIKRTTSGQQPVLVHLGNGVFAGQRGLVGRLFLKKIAFFFVFYPIITTFVILLGFSENTANY